MHKKLNRNLVDCFYNYAQQLYVVDDISLHQQLLHFLLMFDYYVG